MNPLVARWSGAAIVLALIVAIGLLVLLSSGTILVSQQGALGGSTVNAEFRDASPLVPGMSVRVSGVVAGTVRTIKLTNRGTAAVELRLARNIPFPRSDATAAIRQADLLGDSYVSLSLGHARAKLHGTIPTSRTLNMPRLDQLFTTFQPKVRAELRALIVELGNAVDGRGDDLNAAILELQPGLKALDDLTAELNGQDTNLKQVLADAEGLTSQLAAHRGDIDGGVQALQRMLTTTAQHAGSLDAALAGAPRSLGTARGVLGRVSALAAGSRPLATTLESAAPKLSRAAHLLGPFASDAQASAQSLSPVLTSMRKALAAGAPVTARLDGIDPVDTLLPGSKLLGILAPVFADGAPALFGADTYGANPKGQTGLGAVAVERGDQPTTPNFDPARTWVRTSTVLTCEMFGLPVKPGCLLDALGSLGRKKLKKSPGGGGAPKLPVTVPKLPPLPKVPVPKVPKLPTPSVPQLPSGLGSQPTPPPGKDPTSQLLNYLLGG